MEPIGSETYVPRMSRDGAIVAAIKDYIRQEGVFVRASQEDPVTLIWGSISFGKLFRSALESTPPVTYFQATGRAIRYYKDEPDPDEGERVAKRRAVSRIAEQVVEIIEIMPPHSAVLLVAFFLITHQLGIRDREIALEAAKMIVECEDD